MTIILGNIEDRRVYPIRVRNHGKDYLTLYYYTQDSDAVLHTAAKRLVYFGSEADMARFCQSHGLEMADDFGEFDYDVPIDNPVDYGRILDNWNLLNTIAEIFGMFFEGDGRKYTRLYNLLFRLNTPAAPIPPTYCLSDRDYRDVLRIFRKKDRYLNLFDLF